MIGSVGLGMDRYGSVRIGTCTDGIRKENWMGRPKMDGAKCRRVQIRLNEEEYQTLKECCEKSQLSKTNVLVRGLYLYRNWLKKVE